MARVEGSKSLNIKSRIATEIKFDNKKFLNVIFSVFLKK